MMRLHSFVNAFVLIIAFWSFAAVAARGPAGLPSASGSTRDDLRGLEVLSRPQRPRYVPDRYIVEFARPQAATSGQSSIESIISSVLSEFQTIFGKVTTSVTFDSPVFYGASFVIQSSDHQPDQIKQLGKNHPAVVSIRQARFFYPTDVAHRRHHARKNFLSLRDMVADHAPDHHPNHTSKPTQDPWGIHSLTGVKQQHDLGFYGEGISFCIADSGVDGGHPSINGGKPEGQDCFGQGCPIIRGVDFVGDNFDGEHFHEGPMKSSSVRGHHECFHGTYTIGHILANDTELGILGSAPRASGTAYRISACTLQDGVDPTVVGAASEELILKTFDRSLREGCSVLSFSFGDYSGWASEPEDVPLNRLYDNGVLPVVSAGNAGNYGSFTSDCPGCVEKTVSVASSDLLEWPGWAATVNPPLPGGQDLALASEEGPTWNETFAQDEVPVWFSPAALKDPNVQDDGCDPISADLSGKVAILFRGTCFLDQKIGNARNASAKHVLVVNNDKNMAYLPLGDVYQAMVTKEQGLQLLSLFTSTSGGVTLSFGKPHVFKLALRPNVFNGGLASAYSSWGPDWDGIIKPDIVAPGGNLPSLEPLPFKFGIISGTSGAAPYFAGAVALFKQIKGEKASPPDVVRRAFYHTAQPLSSALNNSNPMSVFKQGHGMMNLTAAVQLTSKADPMKVYLGDTPRANLSHVIQITNEGPSPQQYTTRHVAAQSFWALQARDESGAFKNPSQGAFLETLETSDAAGSAAVSPSSFTLAPGASVSVTLTVTPPAPSDRINLYSGWVFFDGSVAGGSLSVPYGGIAGDLAAIPTFITQFEVFNTTTPALYTSSLTEQIRNDSTAWTLNEDDFPILVWQNQVGSPYSQCDLVPANITFTATQPISDDPTCCSGVLSKASHQERALDLPIIGQLGNHSFAPRDYTRSDDVTQTYYHSCDVTRLTDPQSGERVKIPPGNYRALLRVQKLFSATFESQEDYASYLSHAFEVK